MIVGSEESVGKIKGPQPLICSGHLVSVGPANLSVVRHHDLRAGAVDKLPQVGPCALLVVAVEYVHGEWETLNIAVQHRVLNLIQTIPDLHGRNDVILSVSLRL